MGPFNEFNGGFLWALPINSIEVNTLNCELYSSFKILVKLCKLPLCLAGEHIYLFRENMFLATKIHKGWHFCSSLLKCEDLGKHSIECIPRFHCTSLIYLYIYIWTWANLNESIIKGKLIQPCVQLMEWV